MRQSSLAPHNSLSPLSPIYSYKLRFTWDGGAKVAQVPKEATFLELKEAASEASGVASGEQKRADAEPPMLQWHC